MAEPAIWTAGLVKEYDDDQAPNRALDGFDLQVDAGMVYGLLGPNGAGKTTAVRALATLLRYDAGRARVAGRDPMTDPMGVRRRIGLSGQTPAVDEILGGRQNLVLFGRLAGLARAAARHRADQLLEQFDLLDAADRQVKHYSGGMRRRLDLAVTLLLRPQVLFLDEPTTGLDPRNRAEVWQAVRVLAAQGTTVLLTTQYLDEADQLAARIAVMDAGQVIAEGTPDDLKRRIGGERLEICVQPALGGHRDRNGPADHSDLATAEAALARWASGPTHADPVTGTVWAPVADRVQAMGGVLRDLQERRVPIRDIALRRPTLDDVFLQLTGRATEPAAGAQSAPTDPTMTRADR